MLMMRRHHHQAKLRTLVAVLMLAGRGWSAPFDYDYDDEIGGGSGGVATSVPPPSPPPAAELEKSLENFLSGFYDKYVNGGAEDGGDIYDRMQGDQPGAGANGGADFSKLFLVNFTVPAGNFSDRNMTDNDYFRTMRNRTKDNWIQALKENILRQIGRANMTQPKPEDGSRPTPFNISAMIPTFLNATTLDDDHITEKIRSYYPSCTVPPSVDQEQGKDDNLMNLYFNFDHQSDERGLNIATATLRLYRVLSENSTRTGGKAADCESSTSSEEDKLLRVSIYWYTKSLRKKRVKKRLSDSKVVPEGARWVELSVKPATRAWARGRNLGLAVLVEDQEGTTLKAERYFKGVSCMVGSSTPKPIPTVIIDAARQTNELDRIHSLLGRNSTGPVSGYVPMLPSIDICTLEFPENYSQPPPHIASLRINACNLKKLHEHSQLLAEKEKLERLAMLPDLLVPSPRHIRHQRQHLGNKMSEFDPRSRMINKRVLTAEELQNLNLDSFNISRIDR